VFVEVVALELSFVVGVLEVELWFRIGRICFQGLRWTLVVALLPELAPAAVVGLVEL